MELHGNSYNEEKTSAFRVVLFNILVIFLIVNCTDIGNWAKEWILAMANSKIRTDETEHIIQKETVLIILINLNKILQTISCNYTTRAYCLPKVLQLQRTTSNLAMTGQFCCQADPLPSV